MADDVIKMLKDVSGAAIAGVAGVAGGAADFASSAAHQAKDAYERTGLKSGVETVSKATKDLLDGTGVSGMARQVSTRTGDTLDTLSGTKLLALVEERLAIQSKYNDILATKLEEALGRIQRLESLSPTKP